MITSFFALLIAVPCEVDGLKADCGTFAVPENHTVAGGHTIDLSYAVLAATPEKRARAPSSAL